MSQINIIGRLYKQNQDLFWLGTYGIAIVFSGYVVGGVVGDAFAEYSGLKETIRTVIDFIPLVSLINIASILFGAYLGLLALLFVDYKKRAQSILLIFGTIFASIVIATQGVLFPWMSPIDYALTVLAVPLTMYLIGGEKLNQLSVQPNNIWRGRLLTTKGNEPIEFPNAARILQITLVVFILISLFEAYSVYDPLLVTNSNIPTFNQEAINSYTTTGSEGSIGISIFFSAVLVGAFTAFLNYDSSSRVVFVGPPRSGKTHAIIGLYSAAQNSNRNPRNESNYLNIQKDAIEQTGKWLDPTQAEIHDLSFTYTTKGIFSKNVTVDGMDYPGEYTYYISDGLQLLRDGMAIPPEPVDRLPPSEVELGSDVPIGEQLRDLEDNVSAKWSWLIENYDRGFEDEYINKIRSSDYSDTLEGQDDIVSSPDRAYIQMVNSILPRVNEADTVVYIFDVEQATVWMQDRDAAEYIGVNYYGGISNRANTRRTIGLATKADYLSENFDQEYDLTPRDDYERYEKYVNNQLLSTPYQGTISSLQLNLLPMYIETEPDDDQPRVPINTFGTDRILERLGE